MSESELISIFDNNLTEFLSNLRKAMPKYKTRADELEKEIPGKLMECIESYSSSVKRYEKRFLAEDEGVVKRINNPIFAKLNMHKLLSESKLTGENRQKVWAYLKTLYMYSEMITSSDRVDMLTLVEKCSPEETENETEDIDEKINQATEMISKMFGGNNESPEMMAFADLIKEVGGQIGSQIKDNGGELDSASVMASFGKMMKGESIGGDIGGIDMSKVIEKASKTLQDKGTVQN